MNWLHPNPHPLQGSISSTFYKQLLRSQTPKAQKSSFFGLSGSASGKAACRTLVKLTPNDDKLHQHFQTTDIYWSTSTKLQEEYCSWDEGLFKKITFFLTKDSKSIANEGTTFAWLSTFSERYFLRSNFSLYRTEAFTLWWLSKSFARSLLLYS